MRFIRSLFLIVVLTLVLGCQVSPFAKYLDAKVSECIDGDTVKLDSGQVVRFIGLDTPELHKKTGENWVDVNEPLALEAKQLNERLVKGKLVRLEFDVELRDKYSRFLAYCFVDNVFVNERILEEGLGLLYTRPPNVRYNEILVAAQKRARNNQKGLWSNEQFISARDAANYIGSIASVEGKVLKVRESEKVIYLNFGKDYKKDFTVVIFRQDLASFFAAGINPVKFKNKTLRVFGKVKDYNGPEIIARHPSQIEVLE